MSIIESLQGDARRPVAPYLPKASGFPGDRSIICPRPMKVQKHIAQWLVESFEEGKVSSHSNLGGSLWILIRYCHENHIPYELQVLPGQGASIKKLEIEK